MKTIPQ